MRKNWLIALLGAVVMAAVPAAALAHAVSGHHQAHHHARHARVRLRHFRPADASGTSGTASGTPSTSSSDNVGTVQSFSPGTTSGTGKLVIALNDGSTVSGNVTGDTELQCESASSSTTQSGDMQSDHQSPTTGTTGSQSGDDQRGDNGSNDAAGSEDRGDDDHAQGNEAQSCTSADLKPGTAVHEAELAITSTGAVWRGVDLVLS